MEEGHVTGEYHEGPAEKRTVPKRTAARQGGVNELLRSLRREKNRVSSSGGKVPEKGDGNAGGT